MGACTVTIDTDGRSPVDASNAGYMIRAKVSPSTSYATGGDTISGSLFGIGTITKILFTGTSGAGATTGYEASGVYDSTGVNVTKVQVFATGSGNQQPFAEIAAATNLSAQVFDCIAWGT